MREWSRLARRTVAILMLAALVRSAASQPNETKADCTQGGQTQYELNLCAGRAADAADKKLLALLAELQPKLGSRAVGELAELQAQWLALRDRDCRWEQRFFEGGSVAPMVNAYCRAAITQERIGRLKTFLCEGAGMTGPCEASRRY